jgi:hypothetical protein
VRIRHPCTGTTAHLPQLSTATELLIIDLVAQDPESDPEFARCCDPRFSHSFLYQFASIEAVQLRISSDCVHCRFAPEVTYIMVANAREDKSLPIYGDGMQERDWLFVEDYCSAIALALDKAKPGALYNVSAGAPQPNLKIVRTILKHLSKPESLMQYVNVKSAHGSEPNACF